MRPIHVALTVSLFIGAVAAAEKGKGNSPDRDIPLPAGAIYRPAPGAQIVGKPVPDPSGESVAFVEADGQAVSLVVAVRGAPPARWPLSADQSKYRIYWISPQRIILGPSPLKPKVQVSWEVASADDGALAN